MGQDRVAVRGRSRSGDGPLAGLAWWTGKEGGSWRWGSGGRVVGRGREGRSEWGGGAEVRSHWDGRRGGRVVGEVAESQWERGRGGRV